MENAGRSLADLAQERFGPASVVVCAGTGGNGGGGLVAARHLANRGVVVRILMTRTQVGGVPAHQLDVCQRMGLEIHPNLPAGLPRPDLWIDAVIGYSLRGEPRGVAAEFIHAMNRSSAPVLSLDTPSGLDTTSGVPGNPTVDAEATLTLAAPKLGLKDQPGVGELYVADISVPPAVFLRLGFASYHPDPNSRLDLPE